MMKVDTDELAELSMVVEKLEQMDPDDLQIIWMRCLSEICKTPTPHSPISPTN